MAFRGYFPPPELTPASCGLLSVARVETHTGREYDERWIRGFDYEFDTLPTVRLLTTNDDAVVGGTLYDGTQSTRYLSYDPFFVEVEDFRSAFDLPGEDRFKRVKKQLEAATQKAVEAELWDGYAATGDANANIFLSKTGEPTLAASGAFNPVIALMYLEQAISDSPTGEEAMIHMTRDVASYLGSYILHKETEEKGPHLITRLGTQVVIGSGYSGNGPVGDTNAAASATNKWMYATGPVQVHLGKIEVINENLAQGVDATINDMRIKAYRPAAVYFDPSIHYTVRVTLPTT
jgi:hypothetical protein